MWQLYCHKQFFFFFTLLSEAIATRTKYWGLFHIVRWHCAVLYLVLYFWDSSHAFVWSKSLPLYFYQDVVKFVLLILKKLYYFPLREASAVYIWKRVKQNCIFSIFSLIVSCSFQTWLAAWAENRKVNKKLLSR